MRLYAALLLIWLPAWGRALPAAPEPSDAEWAKFFESFSNVGEEASPSELGHHLEPPAAYGLDATADVPQHHAQLYGQSGWSNAGHHILQSDAAHLAHPQQAAPSSFAPVFPSFGTHPLGLPSASAHAFEGHHAGIPDPSYTDHRAPFAVPTDGYLYPPDGLKDKGEPPVYVPPAGTVERDVLLRTAAWWQQMARDGAKKFEAADKAFKDQRLGKAALLVDRRKKYATSLSSDVSLAPAKKAFKQPSNPDQSVRQNRGKVAVSSHLETASGPGFGRAEADPVPYGYGTAPRSRRT